MPRKIKKYANRKLYDTTEKKYISLDELSELVKAGEEVAIEDNETGEDLTSSVLSQLLARERGEDADSEIAGILTDLLRKGRGTLTGYARKYTSLLQNAVTMAEDEVEKLVNMLVKNKEITESEAGKLKEDLIGYAKNMRKWVTDRVDQQISEAFDKMNLATREQMTELAAKIDSLTKTVERLEKLHADETSVEEKEELS